MVIFGGTTDGGKRLDDLWLFDLDSNIWSKVQVFFISFFKYPRLLLEESYRLLNGVWLLAIAQHLARCLLLGQLQEKPKQEWHYLSVLLW